jgi:hypothetical protein
MDTLVIGLPIFIPESFFKCNPKWKEFETPQKIQGYSLIHNGIHFQYFITYQYLMLSVSITKFLYGANFSVLNRNDIDKFCCEVNYLLNEIFELLNDKFKTPDLTNIKEWTLNRFDLVANFVCPNNNVKKTTLDVLKQLDYPYLKKKIYDTSLSARNNSICVNVYDKNAEVSYRNKTNNNAGNSLNQNILRFEIQLKKNSIKSLVRKGFIGGNKFKNLLSNLNNITIIFKYYLHKYGIFKKFLSKYELNSFLSTLLKRKQITAKEYENIKLILIDKSKEVCKNTKRKYIKLLSQYDISHIFTENHLEFKINFSNFELFRDDQLKSSYDHKFTLYELSVLKSDNRPKIKILINLIRPVKIIEILDDS